MDSTKLSGTVALVTGASRGIGRAVAVTLAEAGAAVGITARTEGDLLETASLAGRQGVPIAAVPGDITMPADVDRVVREIENRLGPVHVLVNNAGVAGTRERPLWEEDRDEWWQILEVNLRGPMLFAHAVLPGMITRRRGYIVNVNSLAGTRPFRIYSAYVVSKAGLFRMTDVLAASLEGTGVCVFDVSPGLVRTEMTQDMPIWGDVPDEDWTPAEKIGEVIVKLTSGRYDDLRGRFIHATEELDALLERLRSAPSPHARRLRLAAAGPDDPVVR